METVNNIAAAAAKAVWGDGTTSKEPVSGQQGNTSQGEPFDKGNIEEPTTAGVTKAATDDTPTSSSASESKTDSEFVKSTEPSTAGVTKTATDDTPTSSSAPTSESKTDAEFAKSTGTAAESDSVPDNKQTQLKAKDTPADTSKGQNDTRDPEDPQTHPKNNPTDVDDTGSGPNEGQKLDGPGPKPLEEVAKEHGGNAGSTEAVNSSGGDAAAEDDPNDPSSESKGEGTGEQYVKSSGLKADGGDFDATKPGAGREADRLLEAKGIHHGKDVEDDTDAASPAQGSGEKEKKSFGTKIKEKLHRK